MSDLLVILGASSLRGNMRDYIFQLSRAGAAVALFDVSDSPDLKGGGQLGYKLATLRQLAETYSGFSRLIVSDGFDVYFYGSSVEEIARRIPAHRVLLAAEKNCYPDPAIAARIPGPGPWRFANGGLTAGTPQALFDLCQRVETYPGYRPDMRDQEFLNILLAEKANLFELDTETRLFFCLYGGYDELQFHHGSPVNAFYDSWPLFIHANGQWPAGDMLERWRNSLA